MARQASSASTATDPDIAEESQVADSAASTATPALDIGRLARWSVSSHKYGYGVNCLRDMKRDTFWQSEGPQPHYIDLAFVKKVLVSSIAICCYHSQDDSYTPKKIMILAGTGLHDLIEVRTVELEKPEGWGSVFLRPNLIDDPNAPEPEDGGRKAQIEVEGPPIPANYVRIQVIENYLNGKDTHIRGLSVFGAPGSLPAPKPRATATGESLPARSERQAVAKPSNPFHRGDGTVTEDAATRHARIMQIGQDVAEEWTSIDFRQYRSAR